MHNFIIHKGGKKEKITPLATLMLKKQISKPNTESIKSMYISIIKWDSGLINPRGQLLSPSMAQLIEGTLEV